MVAQTEIKANMETPAPETPTIESAGPVVELSPEEQLELAKIDKKLPLSYALRVTLAKLTVAARRNGRPRSLTAQASAEARAERRHRGWRAEIDRMAERAQKVSVR